MTVPEDAAQAPPRAKASRPRTKPRDWEAIRAEYIASPTTSIEDVARRHGVPYETARQQSKRHKWGPAKEAFLRERAEQMLADLKDEQVEFGVQKIRALIRLSTRGFSRLEREIDGDGKWDAHQQVALLKELREDKANAGAQEAIPALLFAQVTKEQVESLNAPLLALVGTTASSPASPTSSTPSGSLPPERAATPSSLRKRSS